MTAQVTLTLPGYVANAIDARQVPESVILELTQNVDKGAVDAIAQGLAGLDNADTAMTREVYGDGHLTLAQYRALRTRYGKALQTLAAALNSTAVQNFIADSTA